MTIHPKNQKDLMLAPVAAEIDRNLQRLRGGSPSDVLAELELELDRPAMCPRARRASRARAAPGAPRCRPARLERDAQR